MRSLVHFFDKLEDGVRERLSHTPIPYAIIGGVTIILLWRGIWHLADELQALGGIWAIIFDPAVSVVISAAILLMTGLFVSFFIGDRIILSGLKHEKKIGEKTEAEVRQEESELSSLHRKLDQIQRMAEHIQSKTEK